MKILDEKLARLRNGYRPADFIIADAKDGDMGFGLTAPGPAAGKPGRWKTKPEYLAAMTEMTESGLVDIMLMSASSAEALAATGLFTRTGVTPAVRLNDTTDIWTMRGQRYKQEASRPFRSAQVVKVRPFANLGLYSMTFSNDVDRDLANVEAYREFREEATAHGMRHFLEVFNPNIDIGLQGEELASFVNDAIVRSLAGLVTSEQPLFLKMPYNGPRAMEELASYNPSHLIVGILGGAKGTTRDTFELVSQAAKYGARVALFGRKINLAESPLDLVSLMRQVIEGGVSPAEAVRAYHDKLHKHGLTPTLALDKDGEITEAVLKAG
jgi:DhnA family fructose-bisphosphate aldolase class Ia